MNTARYRTMNAAMIFPLFDRMLFLGDYDFKDSICVCCMNTIYPYIRWERDFATELSEMPFSKMILAFYSLLVLLSLSFNRK